MKEKSTEFGCWSLGDIIEGRYFRVPDYQRGYAWGDRQLEEFWEDLQAVMKSGGKHYTGAITVKALPGPAEMTSRKGFAVVDGQQRMTTIAILLAVLKREGNPFLLRETQGDHGDHYVFSYGPQNVDVRFFRDILSGRNLTPPQNSHQRNLKKALEYFQAKAIDFGADAQTIADVLMSRLTFDFRVIGTDYNDGVVFETMNNRGKSLTLLEKLKNRLMYLTDALTSDGDTEAHDLFEDEKSDLRKEIDDSWGEIYRLLASNPDREPLDEDEFIAAHLSIYRAPKESVYSKSVAESRLFKMFSPNAERHPKSERVDENDVRAVARAAKEDVVSIAKIRDYVEDLMTFAKPWSKIHDDYDTAIGRCRLLSGTLEVKVFLSSALLHVDDEEVAASIFGNVERILFRNTIQSVMDEATLATLARRLHGKSLDMLKRGENEGVDAKGVDEFLQGIASDEWRQLDRGKIVDYFADQMNRQQSPYGFYGWRGLKYFLFKQEGEAGLKWSRYDEVTLEHIMPQSSTADGDDGWWVRQMEEFAVASGFGGWVGLSDKEKRACRQRKRTLVNSLGNFVLLTQSENASVSDDPWEGYSAVVGKHKAVIGKKAFYSDPVRLSSSGARRVAQTEGNWNAFRIRERGRALFRELASALGVTDHLDDSDCDLALGFDAIKSLENSAFELLPEDDVNRLAPKLGTAAEPRLEANCESKVDDDNIAFWSAFKEWCLNNGHKWCTAKIAQRGNSYYDPQGGGECYLFFTVGEKSGNVKGEGRLVTVGIYCASGEELRNQIREWRDDFDMAFQDCPFDFQEWEYGNGRGRRILFVRRADYLKPPVDLFQRMADDYERMLAVLNRHGIQNRHG